MFGREIIRKGAEAHADHDGTRRRLNRALPFAGRQFALAAQEGSDIRFVEHGIVSPPPPEQTPSPPIAEITAATAVRIFACWSPLMAPASRLRERFRVGDHPALHHPASPVRAVHRGRAGRVGFRVLADER